MVEDYGTIQGHLSGINPIVWTAKNVAEKQNYPVIFLSGDQFMWQSMQHN